LAAFILDHLEDLDCFEIAADLGFRSTFANVIVVSDAVIEARSLSDLFARRI
jgi:hypothetical protein